MQTVVGVNEVNYKSLNCMNAQPDNYEQCAKKICAQHFINFKYLYSYGTDTGRGKLL